MPKRKAETKLKSSASKKRKHKKSVIKADTKSNELPKIGKYFVLNVPLSSDDTFNRFIYFTEHKDKNTKTKYDSDDSDAEDDGTGRTLFVTNLPPFTTTAYLTRIFSTAGDVSNVTLGALKDHSTYAHVIFASKDGVKNAMSMSKPRFNAASEEELDAAATEESVGLKSKYYIAE